MNTYVKYIPLEGIEKNPDKNHYNYYNLTDEQVREAIHRNTYYVNIKHEGIIIFIHDIWNMLWYNLSLEDTKMDIIRKRLNTLTIKMITDIFNEN